MFRQVLHIAVPLVLILLILRAVGSAEVLARLRASDPAWVLAALLAAEVQIVTSAMRWRMTSGRLGAPISLSRAIGEYYLSGLINMTLPGGVVGDAARAVRNRGAAGFETAAQAVVIERIAGQIALALVMVAGIAAFGSPAMRYWALGASVVVAALVVAVPRARLPGVLRRFGTAMRASWFGGRTFAAQAALSLVIVVANLATFAFAAAATGTVLGPFETFVAVPLVLAAMLIPFSVGGWGYREGAAAAVFPLIGASASAGVGASLLFGVIILVANLPGLWVLMRR